MAMVTCFACKKVAKDTVLSRCGGCGEWQCNTARCACGCLFEAVFSEFKKLPQRIVEEPEYYDKEGNRITIEEWREKRKDEEYQRVGDETVGDGTRIITAWIGNDISGGLGGPTIFKTFIIPARREATKWLGGEYDTLAEAEVGHRATVVRWLRRHP